MEPSGPKDMKKTAFIILCSFFSLSQGCASFFFFDPRKEFVSNPAVAANGYRDVFFRTSDNVRLNGWFMNSRTARKGTIIYLHGYSQNISSQADKVLWLTGEGYDVFAFDYRGYGRSEGSPTIEGVHKDTQAAFETVFKEVGPDEKVFVLGQSLGGAIAVYSVASSLYKERLSGLIIDCAFSSYRQIAADKISELPVFWRLGYFSGFITDEFSPVRWIDKVGNLPVVIIHAGMDEVIPVRHAFKLFSAASEPKELWIAEGKGHVLSFTDEGIKRRLVDFLTGGRGVAAGASGQGLSCLRPEGEGGQPKVYRGARPRC